MVSKLGLVFVYETMIKSMVAKNLKFRLGSDCSFEVGSIRRSGGLCVYWNSSAIDFHSVSFSYHHICGDITGANGVK